MRLRHYMRGLGVGIAVTVLLFHIAQFGAVAKTMSDEDILKRAKELGMIENTILGTQNEPDNDTEAESETKAEDEPNAEEGDILETSGANENIYDMTPIMDSELSKTDKTEAAKPDNASDSSKPVKTDDAGNKPAANNEATGNAISAISIEVKRGDGSMNVAKRLEEAGLVRSATEFDKFLCDKDYDNILSIGVHMIPRGSNEEEIAQILMSK